MIDGSTGQHHRVVIGRLRRITPCLLSLIPNVISDKKSDNPLREIPPDAQRKVHLSTTVQHFAVTLLTYETCGNVVLILARGQHVTSLTVETIKSKLDVQQ